MKICIGNVTIYRNGVFVPGNIIVEDGIVCEITSESALPMGTTFFDFNNGYVFPGFVDVHVHLREPGFSYKEGIRTGTMAAAAGGFTRVCAMPNLVPVPDSVENLQIQLDAIEREAVIGVVPYGAITRGQKGEHLSDMSAMAGKVAGFSDDGRGVQSAKMMEAAMREAKRLGRIIVAHCEDESLLNGGCIHDCDYAKAHGFSGISAESEWGQIERDLKLAAKTGCAYHICHISTEKSVQLIRQAKADGVNVTCETAPHYLLLNDSMLQDDGRFKMNPPIRSEADRRALIEGLKDGTVDMIATDHAPHSAEEKSGGLKNSLNGITGLETAFPVLYTGLVLTGEITLEKLIALMHDNPCRRFGIGREIQPGKPADLTVFDLGRNYKIQASELVSKGKSTPFDGWEVFGKCRLTLADGKTVWEDKTLNEV